MVTLWAGPMDSFMLDGELILRIDRYDEQVLVLSISTAFEQAMRSIDLSRDEWTPITKKLKMMYCGIRINNAGFQPPERAQLRFDDQHATVIERHTFAGAPIRSGRRIGLT